MSKLIKLFSIFAVGVFLTAGTSVLAQENITDQETTPTLIATEATEAIELDEDITAEDLGIKEPTILPDSPFYFTKNWRRGIQSFFTFNPIKKAELKLKFSNEKLLETKKMVEKGASSEKITIALNNYQNEIAKIKEEVEKRGLKMDGNPKVEKFFEKLIDRNLKHQRLLDKLEKQLPEDSFQKIEEIKERVLEKFTNTSLKITDSEKFQEKLEKIAKEQKGSRFKHIKNLEVLMRVEEKVPENAKEAIKKAQENVLKRLKGDLEAIPEEEKPILKKYLEKIGGNEMRHLQIISNLETTELPSDIRKIVEEGKEKSIKRIDKRLKKIKDDAGEEEYLKHLKIGKIKNLEIIKELEENLSPEAIKRIIKIKETTQKNFNKKIEMMSTTEEKEAFFKKIELMPNVRMFEILKEMEDTTSSEIIMMLKEIETRISDEMRKKINTATTEAERKQILEAFSSDSITADEIIEKIGLPRNVINELKTIEINRIKRKIQIIEDPQRLEFIKRKIEAQKVSTPDAFPNDLKK